VEVRRPYPGVGQALLLLLLQFCLALGLYILTAIVAAVYGLAVDEKSPLLTFLEVFTYGIILYVGFLSAGRPLRSVFPFTGAPAALLLLLLPVVIGTGILTSEVDNLTRWFFPVPPIVTEMFGDLLAPDLLSLLTVTVIGPVNEELLFRGLILCGFLRRYSARTAVLASAAIFAVFHLNPYQFFGAFVAGIVLAWLFRRTGSLWPCIAAHALFNAQAWVIANLVDLGIPGYDPVPAISPVVEFQPWWFDVLGIVLVAAGILTARRLTAQTRPAEAAR